MEDWRAGKDFKIIGGPYCSNRDIEYMTAEGFQMLEFMLDGELLERIFLNHQLDLLCEQTQGTFTRVS